MKKVSVLIPAYNVEKYISQCLESVCNQTYPDIEIIVIDDGSNDATFSIISKYAKDDPRIAALSRENKGVAHSRNELLDHAKGEYVLFVDSDDWIEPDMISTLVGLSEKYSVDLVMCRNVNVNTTKNDSVVDVWNKDEILKKFLEHRELTGSLCNKLIKRQLFDGIRFTPGISYGEDAMVIWDIIGRLDKMVYTTEEFYHYRMNATSISHQGLSEAKMSVLQVWDYISNSDLAQKHNLTKQAKARYGAEITLLLLAAIGDKATEAQNRRIKVLRNRLKELYPYMLGNCNLSCKFKTFAGMTLLNWPLLTKMVKCIYLNHKIY